MSVKNLDERMKAAGGALNLLRDSQTGPNPYPVVKPEYSNWRDEQQAWQKAAVIFNQSYHMTDLYVSGPDAFKLLESLGINSFAGFVPGKAKQYVPTTWDGHVIGDVILCFLAKNKFNLIGRPPVINWVTYHAETGKNPATGKKWQVKLVRDDRSADRKNPNARKTYRYQVQGPNAMKVMTKVLKKAPPDLKFFNMADIKIAGKTVHALRHGMAGQPGFELFGPAKDGEAVLSALQKAGEEFGLKLVGGRAYSSNTLESGWIPCPMPGIYSGDERMAKYRMWLGATSFEGNASLGGSYYSKSIDDHYVTPHDLGYGFMIKFDHDFIGREALEKVASKPHRVKVTLELNDADVQKALASQYGKDGERSKFIEFPSAVYSMYPQDKVLSKDGKQVGISTWMGYSSNERKQLTLAYLEPESAKSGTEVVFVWGEENGGSKKPQVEAHKQVQIRAIVCPVPYVASVRSVYAEGSWREKGKAV
ncbi:MAG: aminomethyl transferase family protein [Steroidobacteraceae bacterium]